ASVLATMGLTAPVLRAWMVGAPIGCMMLVGTCLWLRAEPPRAETNAAHIERTAQCRAEAGATRRRLRAARSVASTSSMPTGLLAGRYADQRALHRHRSSAWWERRLPGRPIYDATQARSGDPCGSSEHHTSERGRSFGHRDREHDESYTLEPAHR